MRPYSVLRMFEFLVVAVFEEVFGEIFGSILVLIPFLNPYFTDNMTFKVIFLRSLRCLRLPKHNVLANVM